MAVEVSDTWKNNQKSTIQKRGFVSLELGNDTTKYTEGYTVTRSGGSQTDEYFFISNEEMSKMDTAEINIIFTSPETTAYRSLYMELETTSTDSNVNYECRDYQGETEEIISYSDNRTIISFPVSAECTAYRVVFKKWFRSDEKIKVKSLCFGKNTTIPSTRIKNCTHFRSYDPMGLELPQNNIQIDILNLDDAYTPFYKEYANERIKITIKYGYVFSNTTEIIQGGAFYTKSVQNDDGILTIQGDNSLTLIDDDETVQFTTQEGRIYYDAAASKTSLTYNDLENDMPCISFESLLDNIKTTWNVNIISNDEFNGMRVIYNSISGKRIEMLQEMINASLQRCRIDRYDKIVIENQNDTQPSSFILLLNSMEKPALMMSKKIRCIVLNSFDFEACTINLHTYSPPNRGATFTIYDIDTTKECIYSVHSPARIREIIKATEKTTDGRTQSYIGSLTTAVSSDTTVNTIDLSSGNITKTIPVNDSGDVCDMTNDISAPCSSSKISAYFSNRHIYKMNVRGNPARDVGDYVWVSQKNDNDSSTFEKGLVLSSELIFDGSFKETLNVRIIETEFETEEESEI